MASRSPSSPGEAVSRRPDRPERGVPVDTAAKEPLTREIPLGGDHQALPARPGHKTLVARMAEAASPRVAQDLRSGHAEQVAPRLERRLSDLVDEAYGLAPEEIDLLWKSAPPRMPRF